MPPTKEQLAKRRVVAEEDSFDAFSGDDDDFEDDDFCARAARRSHDTRKASAGRQKQLDEDDQLTGPRCMDERFDHRLAFLRCTANASNALRRIDTSFFLSSPISPKVSAWSSG